MMEGKFLLLNSHVLFNVTVRRKGFSVQDSSDSEADEDAQRSFSIMEVF